MAQTKRKRQTKHRGNAAGVVETRGRTGRPLTASEKKPDAKQTRLDKLNQPPTWRAATMRSGIATVIFVALVMIAFKQPVGTSVGIACFVFLFYIPLGYYTDLFMYRRRMKKAGTPDATKVARPAAKKKG